MQVAGEGEGEEGEGDDEDDEEEPVYNPKNLPLGYEDTQIRHTHCTPKRTQDCDDPVVIHLVNDS